MMGKTKNARSARRGNGNQPPKPNGGYVSPEPPRFSPFWAYRPNPRKIKKCPKNKAQTGPHLPRLNPRIRVRSGYLKNLSFPPASPQTAALPLAGHPSGMTLLCWRSLSSSGSPCLPACCRKWWEDAEPVKKRPSFKIPCWLIVESTVTITVEKDFCRLPSPRALTISRHPNTKTLRYTLTPLQ